LEALQSAIFVLAAQRESFGILLSRYFSQREIRIAHSFVDKFSDISWARN
jgi:hypothetical protein